MASNYTTNYQLCQWEAEDQVLREEFNGDNSKIDAALHELAAQADTKASQSALDALSAQLETKADQTALDNAVATIPKIAAGSYTGNGQQKRTIYLGFTPKAVFVNNFFGAVYDFYDGHTYRGGLAVTDAPLQWYNNQEPVTILKIANGGFSVFYQITGSSTTNTNASGTVYHYLAIG